MKNLNTLTGIKREVAELFLQGFTHEEITKKLCVKNGYSVNDKAHNTYKSYVTMGLNKLKEIYPKFVVGAKQETTKKEKEYDGPGKQDWRFCLATLFQRAKQKYGINRGEVLTLSSKNPRLEIMLHTICSMMKFISYEIKPEDFQILVDRIKADKLTYLKAINGLLNEAIYTAKRNQYSHLILDYCLSLNTLFDEIDYAMGANIVRLNGLISITLTSRSPIKGYNTKKELQRLIDRHKDNYRVVMTDVYGGGCKSGKGRDGAPMVWIIFERIK